MLKMDSGMLGWVMAMPVKWKDEGGSALKRGADSGPLKMRLPQCS